MAASGTRPANGTSTCRTSRPLTASCRLAAGREEVLQQACGGGLTDAAIDFGRVVAGGLAEKARPVLHGAALGIARAEIEPADAGEGDGAGTHGAGLQRHIEIAVHEALASERGAGLADGQQLRMGCLLYTSDA